MFVRRLAVVGLVAAACVPAVPSAAQAHGAPVTPISRTAACAGNGTDTRATACQAALKATGGFLGAYDNLRLAGVGGRDRQRVPDGKLCSGGIDLYAGLDLARDDFPSTKVRSGQRLAVSYRGTIPHQGEFRLYLTRSGYSPEEKLTWDDLGADPLAEITDPPLTDGAYRMRVTLPQRTGRHVLYVVWETSSTPDTYYSCSDLVFPAAAVKKAVVTRTPTTTTTKPPTTAPAAAAPATAVATAVATAAATPVTTSSPAEAAAIVTANPTPVAAEREDDGGMVGFGHWLIVGALAAAALAGAGVGLAGLRRRRGN